MDNNNITISSDIFLKIFVKNSTIDCVFKDRQIENDLSKLSSNQVTLCFISNYIQKKVSDLMIEQYRYLNSLNSQQHQFNQQQYAHQQPACQSYHYGRPFHQAGHQNEPLYDSAYASSASSSAGKNVGRLGPPHVQFDLGSLVGQITIDRSTNTLMSNSGFCTIKANCYLYSGKFQYEAMLLTNGIMQLGFASTSSNSMCSFTVEKGVGDSLNSYSYDGNRQKKWNLTSSDYGDKWETHDVISVCIDLDECTVSYYRNGKFLGIAFSRIQTGAGIAYTPAVSLAYNERLIVNFGSSRFKYPVENYQPLELQSQFEITKSNMLIEWLFNLILLKCQTSEEIYQNVGSLKQEHCYQAAHSCQSSQKSSPIRARPVNVENPFFYLTTSLIMEQLEDLLLNEYIIETCLFKHLILYHTKDEIHCFLDIVWSLLNEANLDLFFNSIVLIIVYGYQFSQFHDEEILLSELNYSASTYSTFQPSGRSTNEISFVSQKQYLYLFLLLIQHKRTRHYLLTHVLFKKNLFFQLLDTKLIYDNTILQKHLFPNLTLLDLNNHFNKMKLNPEDDSGIADSAVYKGNEIYADNYGKAAPKTSSKANQSESKIWRNLDLESSLFELESLQNMVIDTLVFQDEYCRTVFIEKFNAFLNDLEKQFVNNRAASNAFTTPLSVLLSVFHRLCFLIRNQYENVITCFPLEFFIDAKYCAKSTTRIGGLYNHLERNHQKEISIYNFELSSTNPLLLQVFILIDHLIRLYSIGVHKQLGKYNSIKELLIEFNNSLKSLDKLSAEDDCFTVHSANQHSPLSKSSSFTSLISQPHPANAEKLRRRASYSRASSASSSTNQLDECRENYFSFSKAVLQKNYLIRGHQYALLNSCVFTYERRQDIIWLLKIILQTLDSSSSSGCLFSYLPQYYLVTCLNLCTALRFYFSNENYQPFDSSQASPLTGSALSDSLSNGKLSSLNNKTQDLEYKQVLKQVCLFITGHFCDERIVNNDHKELIAQSLTSFSSSKQGLNILENISIENRLNLIKKLTQPFENRPWTHSNLILLRFWKGGSGFAFKKETLLKLSNSLADENLNYFVKNELILNELNPSLVFQQLIIDYFHSSPKQAYLFLTSLLNQLNWSFSEFIGVLQDIQNSTIRQECYLAIDNRQLKICSTCFDLSTALLRVLEMIVHYEASLMLTNHSYPVDKKCLAELFANDYGLNNFSSYFGIGDEVPESEFGASFEHANLVPNFDAGGFCANLNNLNANLENNFGASFDKNFNANFDSGFSSSFGSNFDSSSFGSKFDKAKQPSTGKDRGAVFCKQETDEILLQQLCSISNQILNRVTMSAKCFRYVRQQLTNSDSSSMNEFSILSAVIAILIELIVKNERTRYLTLNLLINDLNFQLSSYLQLIGEAKPERFGDAGAASKKTTNFVRYLNGDELKELKRMLIYVASFNERNEKLKSLETFQEEDLCTICYNEKKTALFIPCLHRSCRSCITIHFLRNSECFFCKMQLEKVQFLESTQVLYPQKVKAK